ncbi:hypothetical protein FHS85_003588 [Rhodoligotrophos appendicifer]|uniref:BA14K family protein n=1 Tax=Rhodoligotrophos appendicifer TaxID=987056 RepID=UPI0019603807|nr:BA14K family protein [Rhodoligotrophos appendicifer]
MSIAARVKSASLVVAVLGAFVTVGTGEAAAQSAQCDRYARDYANQYTNPAGNVLGGAVAGAIGGAALGGILGGGKGAGRGAAIGAGVGAVGGAANQGGQWNQYYYAAYNDCMAQNVRAPAPQPVYRGGGYEPWSREWYQYCQQRYRSFNPQTGYFNAGGGRYKFCQ